MKPKNRSYRRPPRPTPNDLNQRAMQLFAEYGRTPTVTPYRDWGNLYVRRPGEPLVDQCGTTAGVADHERNNTPICNACLNARTVQRDSWKVAYNAKRGAA